ncbi:hypothetical protein, partial [Clostridium sp. UBA1056]|uniref:hypothetical protein n=1 Tax=Clostridium sp. UBA1056 TaxID=1946346 RepID=UPI003217D129
RIAFTECYWSIRGGSNRIKTGCERMIRIKILIDFSKCKFDFFFNSTGEFNSGYELKGKE